MNLLERLLFTGLFRETDKALEGLREIRDSYRALNVEIYGEQMASLLNDW